ncbi:Zinc-type alcohol dehydrogenase-like protein PB24D3.08c [Hypsizygus marmoreus]|uniref:Zinc-type alcohol dehydrogenase-like protein PB24D3.08c n=1 Tax=Hypsizygus marmoreus TaxID=39966 RepID=A0A369JQW9_HYPMA|nr:Zinc-type alcohol dehydrogenase-like protein PB24D3.08c [Hypsizygus marmoreus]
MTSNPRVVFAKRPGDALPVVGEHIILDTSRTIDLDKVPLNGGFLTKTLILSPEPAIRERMRDPSITSYSTTYTVGAPIVAFAVVLVLRSEKEGINVGDYMYGQTIWEAYTVQPYIEGRINYKPEDWAPDTFDMDSLALRTVPNPNGLYPLSRYTSLLGTPGLTAFVGFEGIVEGKEGQTIFVSSGGSGVGAMVVQLSKLKGMKVIASVGSDAKAEYVRRLGADVVFNYKKQSYESALAQHGPINVYWDNVGGESLDAALEALVPLGRAVICGVVSSDNVPPAERYRLKNSHLIMKKRLTLRGFIVPDLIPQFIGKFMTEVPALMATGKLKSEEAITQGFENAPQAIVNMLSSGHNAVGKPVVVVAE